MATALRVLYADAALVLLDKPAGLLSVPGRTPLSSTHNAHSLLAAWARSHGSLRAQCVAHPAVLDVVRRLTAAEAGAPADAPLPPSTRYRALRGGALPWTLEGGTHGGGGAPPPPTPLLVHRLDEATSGLLMFAWRYPTQRALQLLLQRPGGGVRKVYEAVVDTRAAEARMGTASPLLHADEGVVDTPLQRHSHLPLLQARGSEAPDGRGDGDGGGGGRACVTRWRVMERGRGAVRLQLEPLTGRTHQLRLHCALPPPYGVGAPILGDAFYGDPALAEVPYLLELLRRGEERDAELAAAAAAGGGGGGDDGTGDAGGGAGSFLTSARALAAEHAARAEVMRAAGGAGAVMPWLASCAPLADAAHTGVRPLPRLLLHARELHLPDSLGEYSLAGRVLGEPTGVPRRGGVWQGPLRQPPAMVPPIPPPPPPGARLRGATSSARPEPEMAAVAAVERMGEGFWQHVAPWWVEDARGQGVCGTPAAVEGGAASFVSPAPF
jgi:23S rRNA-/tRNA-specific pseudouridylate synthase